MIEFLPVKVSWRSGHHYYKKKPLMNRPNHLDFPHNMLISGYRIVTPVLSDILIS